MASEPALMSPVAWRIWAGSMPKILSMGKRIGIFSKRAAQRLSVSMMRALVTSAPRASRVVAMAPATRLVCMLNVQ